MAEMPEDDLEPLITECPSCQTRFRVSEPQLQRARGRVRCGACLQVFHGIEHLVLESLDGDGDEEQARRALDALLDELAGDGSQDDAAAADTSGTRPAAPADRAARRRPSIFSGFEEATEDAGADAAANLADAEESPADVPIAGVAGHRLEDLAREEPEPRAPRRPGQASDASGTPAAGEGAKADRPVAVARSATVVDAGQGAAAHTRRAADRRAGGREPEAAADGIVPVIFGEQRGPRPLVWLGIALGILALSVQVLWYQFDDWAREPQWRGFYQAACGVLGCELPVQRDIAALNTRNLVVRTHPNDPGALRVNAVIVNRAEFAQPFPVLELQFTTVQGSLVASRRFEPDEYLAGDGRGMTLMPPRTPVQIELNMHDPGPAAVNYRLNFR